MEHVVVTIARQYGSGGRAVGEKVGKGIGGGGFFSKFFKKEMFNPQSSGKCRSKQL